MPVLRQSLPGADRQDRCGGAHCLVPYEIAGDSGAHAVPLLTRQGSV
jgi:hypothetical protein